MDKKITNDNTCKHKQNIIVMERNKNEEVGNVMRYHWFAVWYILMIHTIGLYTLVTFDYFRNLKTILWVLVMHDLGCIGVTAGSHRLWSHRAYSANLPLKLILIICYSSTGEMSVFNWVRFHRVHHKYTDTEFDPHNSRRSFFYCHIGWLLQKCKPEVVQKLKEVDMRDILTDTVVMFHKKYVNIINPIFSIVLPTLVPVYFWDETWDRAFLSQIVRLVFVLHAFGTVNSFAHMWGAKPYDKNICPTENTFVCLFSNEGFHNYHHVFPWDYQASEFNWYVFNRSSFFIDMFAKIGWAYDLKKPSPQLIRRVAANRGYDSYVKWYEIPPSHDEHVIN